MEHNTEQYHGIGAQSKSVGLFSSEQKIRGKKPTATQKALHQKHIFMFFKHKRKCKLLLDKAEGRKKNVQLIEKKS